ncbi:MULTISPECIES: FG-GAP-like repeat-containing protein [unclassified Streptomyces]|uniref:FG-GAP-like repeat-containing protein n=1 Tax=unclassified Streptomyces TaxID=2593676 RepID=UPI0033C35DC3
MSSRLVRGGLAAAVTAGLAAAVTTVTTAPARAASGYDRCAYGKLCVFSDPMGRGDMLVVTGSMLRLGSWDNRISSFVNRTDMPVCFNSEPDLEGDPGRARATHYYSAQVSFDESSRPDLDNSVSSLDLDREADYFCGTEGRFPTYSGDFESKPRPAGQPAAAAFGDMDGDGFGDLYARDAFGRLWADHSYVSKSGNRLVGGGWNAMTRLTRHGDYDGDAKEDLFARDRSGVLWFYPGRGDGALGDRVRVGGGWNAMSDVAAAGDLTGDGRADLLAADTTGTLWTYPGDGHGTFGDRRKVGGGWKVMNELVGAGDMNADQRSDLVARDTAGKLWFYPGTGRGTFGDRRLIGTGGWNGLTELAGVGDVTGDGHPDLLAHAPGQKELRVYPDTGAADGGLRAPRQYAQARSTHLVF